MVKITANLPDLMEKVKFCRIKPGESGAADELIWGDGIVVGLIIGVNQRANVMVKDSETSMNKAYTVEPMCINPTEEQANIYLAHRQQLNSLVQVFNQRAKAAIDEGNITVDNLNETLFGPKVQF